MESKSETPDEKEKASTTTSNEEDEYRHQFEEQFEEPENVTNDAVRRNAVLDAIGSVYAAS